MPSKKSKSSSKGSKSSSKKKSSKSSKSSSKSSSKPVKTEEEVMTKPTAIEEASPDFEAGIIFQKYDQENRGALTPSEFRRLWSEQKSSQGPPTGTSQGPPSSSSLLPPSSQTTGGLHGQGVGRDPGLFEYGKLFGRFDQGGEGKLSKRAFEQLMEAYRHESGGVESKRREEELRNIREDPALSQREKDAAERLNRQQLLSYRPVDPLSGEPLLYFNEETQTPMSLSQVERLRRERGDYSPRQGPSKQGGFAPTAELPVVSLGDAYRRRFEHLHHTITSSLLPKRSQLSDCGHQLQLSEEEIETVADGIERETRKDTEGILSRLQAVASLKRHHVEQEMYKVEEALSGLDRYLREIDGLTIAPSSLLLTADPLSSSSSSSSFDLQDIQKAIAFLQSFPHLLATSQQLAQRKLRVQTVVSTEDFPREVRERQAVMDRCDEYEKVIALKDQMLWDLNLRLGQTKEQLEVEKQVAREYGEEVEAWVDLVEKLRGENELLKRQLRGREGEEEDSESEGGKASSRRRRRNPHHFSTAS